MSDMEKIRHEVRLSETKQHIQEVRLKLDRLRSGLRQMLDPFDPVDGMESEVIASLALELAAQHGRLLELLAQAGAIRKALEC